MGTRRWSLPSAVCTSAPAIVLGPCMDELGSFVPVFISSTVSRFRHFGDKGDTDVQRPLDPDRAAYRGTCVAVILAILGYLATLLRQKWGIIAVPICDFLRALCVPRGDRVTPRRQFRRPSVTRGPRLGQPDRGPCAKAHFESLAEVGIPEHPLAGFPGPVERQPHPRRTVCPARLSLSGSRSGCSSPQPPSDVALYRDRMTRPEKGRHALSQ